MFQDFMVEDFIGQIPKDIREPSIVFLSKGKETLTRYFLYQAYTIQRRAVADIPNAERFQGMLVFMKILLSSLETSTPRETVELNIPEEKKEDPLVKVDTFTKGMKERITK